MNCRPHTVQPPARVERGMALIAVLVALAVLLAMAGPFVLSMGRGDAAARAAMDEVRAEWGARSARDAVLQSAAESSYGFDRSPTFDSRAEFPAALELPEALAEVTDSGFGNTLLQARVEDSQRFVHLDTATPLLLANLLDLAVRTTTELELDDDEITVDGPVDAFPESGFLLVGREVIRYASREGSVFRGLQRGLLAELGYFPAELVGDHIVAADSLVLDLRCVMAVSFPHRGDGFPMTRTPYGAVSEVQRIESLGLPGFGRAELETLERYCTTAGLRENAARWGRPLRVFQIRGDSATDLPRILQVKSGAGIGAGRVVRVRSLDGERQEYALVARTVASGNSGGVALPNHVSISLMLPLAEEFEALDTVVEPLVPVPINVNTAEEEVLGAVLAHLRPNVPGVVRDGVTQNRPPYLSTRKASELAQQLVALRGDHGDELPYDLLGGVPDDGFGDVDLQPRPFDGWEDFARRFVPLVWAGGSGSRQHRTLALRVYEALRVGATDRVQMATAPIAFHSAPLVRYRASAARLKASGTEVARRELQGEAIALPGARLGWGAATQELLEEFWRLDRHSPWWMSGPINTSAVQPNRRGTVPALRTEAHLLADVFPGMGFGRRRFPDRDGDDGYVRPQPASTPWSLPDNVHAHESFLFAHDPEGRDLAREGVYRILNTGERGTPGAADAARESRRHDQIAFPLTTTGGLTARHGVSFWFRLREVGEQTLFDLADPSGDAGPERNRIRVEIREQHLRFEVLAEAGLDPDPSQSIAAPRLSSGRWEVPIADLDLQPETWYHANFSAHGDRPGQLSFLIDGVPRGEPEQLTYLTDALPPYEPEQGRPLLGDDRARYQPLAVESTEGFPEQGVLRIGLELFEYTSKDDTTFYCRHANSHGGRQARTWTFEYSVRIPDADGRDLDDEFRRMRDLLDFDVPAPDHPAGSAVELYGYSVPVYPASVLTVGDASLVDALGPFGVARVVNQDTRAIQVGTTNQSFDVGVGLDENWSGDLALGDPVSDERLTDASEVIQQAFPASGGYALLVQKPFVVEPRTSGAGLTGDPINIGGLEVISYGSRVGSRLTGVRRAVPPPVALGGASDNEFLRLDRPRKFVVDWSDEFQSQGQSLDLLPRLYPYVVPISINVNGQLNDATDFVQWLQIRPAGGDDADTEWVRYNAIERNRVVRADVGAYRNTMRQLVGTRPVLAVVTFNPNQLPSTDVPLDDQDVQEQPYPQPVNDPTRRVGWIEDPEQLTTAAGEVARRALRFRGDDFRDLVGGNQGRTAPYVETSSHSHAAGTQVLPVHRFEFERGGFGLSAPRPGRLDRVALAQGSRRQVGETPAVQWQTVNWAVPVPRSDNIGEVTTGNQPGAGQLWGPYPFYLVAFQDAVRLPLVGEGEPSFDREENQVTDVRLVDRMVKFPSGELPAVDADEAIVGGSALGDGVAARGLLDEVRVVARMAFPRPLDQQLAEDAAEFFVRPNVLMTPNGQLEGGRPFPMQSYGRFDAFPEHGGLLRIDGELLAYESYDPSTGRVQIAADGRGLLGTQPRAHDEGAVVQFLEHVPTAILSSGLSESDHEIQTAGLGFLPRHGGTLLVGGGVGGADELLHYTWSRGDQTLGMPRFRPSDETGRAEIGLLRGRYGTAARAASSGAPVIWFPQRYWDRQRPRAVDPECAYAQFTLDQGSVWFGGFAWQEEIPDATLDVHCLVRIDERAGFDQDPEQTPGLFRFEDGQPSGRANPIRMHGRRFEARFVTVYKPGAFDSETWRAHGWKRAPNLRWFLLDYEGETRILDERVTAR